MKNKNVNALHVSKRNGQTTAVKKGRIDGVRVWKQFEDLVVPRLRLTAHEQTAYSYLLRHTRLEGKPRLRFSIPSLARGANLSKRGALKAVRGLVAKGVLRQSECGRAGHVIAVRLPEEIRAVRSGKSATGEVVRPCTEVNLEKADFLQTAERREAIHAREGGRCFYCMRQLKPRTQCLDHVVPQVQMGDNSYRNLVSCCTECNTQKRQRRVEDFLRGLYRDGRLSSSELSGRLRALTALAAGKLKPQVLDQR